MTSKPEQILPSVNISRRHKRSWVINVAVYYKTCQMESQKGDIIASLFCKTGVSCLSCGVSYVIHYIAW